MRHLSAFLKRILRRAVPFRRKKVSPLNATEIGKLGRTARTAVWIRDRLFFICDEYGGAIEQ